MRPIVCGVDGSVDATAALAVAARLAARIGARLVLAHSMEYVVDRYAAAAPLGGLAPRTAITGGRNEQEEAAARLLERVAGDAGLVDVDRRLLFGVPADSLADLADDEGAEFIVVGSRGRGAFKAAVLGSVSNSLVGVARCPVLIVPPAATYLAGGVTADGDR